MNRFDVELVTRGLVSSRNRAAREIAAGRVQVNGHVVTKPSTLVQASDTVELTDADPWVARSAHKLIGALDHWGLGDVNGQVCIDAGASTGGFTQVLLARGAAHVYAIDVGHGQLDASLAQDSRVTNVEGHNLRDLTPDWTAGQVDLVVADVSFISLTLLVEPLVAATTPGGALMLLVKPQFELGRQALDKHGVVTSAKLRAQAVTTVSEALQAAGAQVVGSHESVLPGPSGNREFFVYARIPTGKFVRVKEVT